MNKQPRGLNNECYLTGLLKNDESNYSPSFRTYKYSPLESMPSVELNVELTIPTGRLIVAGININQHNNNNSLVKLTSLLFTQFSNRDSFGTVKGQIWPSITPNG